MRLLAPLQITLDGEKTALVGALQHILDAPLLQGERLAWTVELDGAIGFVEPLPADDRSPVDGSTAPAAIELPDKFLIVYCEQSMNFSTLKIRGLVQRYDRYTVA